MSDTFDSSTHGRKTDSSGIVEGTVTEALPNAMLGVALDDGQKITTHISGAVRTRLVRVVPGDRVRVELSPYDLSRGRITELLR